MRFLFEHDYTDKRTYIPQPHVIKLLARKAYSDRAKLSHIFVWLWLGLARRLAGCAEKQSDISFSIWVSR